MKPQLNTVVIAGASGLLGRNFVKNYLRKDWKVIALYNEHSLEGSHDQLILHKINILDVSSVEELLNTYKPTLIIHCAGLTNVDLCEAKPDLAYALNGASVRSFASYAQESQAQFVYISTDHLFAGGESFYTEIKTPEPINIYGKSKRQGEEVALEENKNSLIIRTNFFGKGTPWRHSFTDWIWNNLRENNPIRAFTDSFFTPISIPKLVEITDTLIEKKIKGIFNVCGAERVSKYEFVAHFANYFNLNSSLITSSSVESANLMAVRPKDMSLSVKKLSEVGITAPTLEESFKSIEHEYCYK